MFGGEIGTRLRDLIQEIRTSLEVNQILPISVGYKVGPGGTSSLNIHIRIQVNLIKKKIPSILR